MSRNHEEASETSPLLGSNRRRSSLDTAALIDPSAGVAPEGATLDQQDGGTIERQDTNEDRRRQYEGDPETKKRMKVMFPALSVGVFLAAADQTLIVSSYGKIGTDLDALNKTSWVATAYFLTLTSFQPLYGKLSDIFGRKSCLLTAYLIFGLGCLGCGMARNINELVAARAVAGIGGGGMTTVVSILLSDAIPLKERGQWQGYINIIFATGSGTGAPLGGLLADSIGWRWSFLFQAPLCLVAFVAVGLLLKLPQNEKSDMKAKLRRIDFLGAAVLVSAVFCLLFGLDRGSNLAWKDAITLGMLAAAFVLAALFILVEFRISAEPVAPKHIIFERSLFACYLCNYFSFAGLMAALFYLSLYYQGYYGATSTQAGLLMIPQIISGVSGSLFGGWYMRRYEKLYWLTVLAYAGLTIGLFVITCFSGLVLHSIPLVVAGAVMTGFGNGIGVTSTLIGLISNAKRDDQATATACSYLFRSLGSTSGVSLSATVFNQVLRTSLANNLGSGKAAKAIEEAARRSLQSIRELKPVVQENVRSSYAMGTRAAFTLELGLVAGAFAAAWFIREKPLSKS